MITTGILGQCHYRNSIWKFDKFLHLKCTYIAHQKPSNEPLYAI